VGAQSQEAARPEPGKGVDRKGMTRYPTRAMRINEIRIQNFKGFKELTETFDSNFTVFVGENGSGKTSVLEAIAFGLDAWPVGMGEFPASDKNRVRIESLGENATIFKEVLPIKVKLEGKCLSKDVSCEIVDADGSDSEFLKRGSVLCDLAIEARKLAGDGSVTQDWPVFGFYVADRRYKGGETSDWNRVLSDKPTRTDAYKNWIVGSVSRWSSKDPPSLVTELSNWLGRQEMIAFQEGSVPRIYHTVKTAILSCMPGAKNIHYSAKHGEPVVSWNDGNAVTFGNLSHGQKSILAMVGDIARRCAMVNPHFETDAPAKTPGIVLIDELDLHLHPRWQRRIVDDLKRTFPEIQFITTTHSPFIIQALEPGELRVLGGEEPKIEYANRGIEEIARFIQGVDMPATSERFTKQKEAAKTYFQMLREGRDESDPELLDAKSKLDRLTVSYADNPGLEAIIEMQEETANPSILVREE